jgi:hypothetical protein
VNMVEFSLTNYIIEDGNDGKKIFHIDVTFEMRTVSYQKAFIQLITLHTIGSSFISKQKRGQEGKIAERKRENKGERASVGCSIGCKTDR